MAGRTDRWFWAAYAVVYDAIWGGPLTALVAARIGVLLPAAGEIVDLGCGTGLVASALRTGDRRVIGVDFAPAMLLRATRRGRLSRAVLADAAATGLAAGSATAVTIVNVLHVHPDPSSVLAEAVRIAKPGASITVVWPVDGVSHDRLNRVDRMLGRSWPRILVADASRRSIGVLATLAGLARRPTTDVGRLLTALLAAPQSNGLTLVERFDVHDCQRLAVLSTIPT